MLRRLAALLSNKQRSSMPTQKHIGQQICKTEGC
jgi:hypothetical protein